MGLRSYYLRPEVHPLEESGEAERRLHAALMRDPRRPVPEAEIAALEDADAQHNYRTVLRFRERLLRAGTVEGCYMSLFKGPTSSRSRGPRRSSVLRFASTRTATSWTRSWRSGSRS